jgi:heparosan-N-sulfate-glucuronate 5-epimerase
MSMPTTELHDPPKPRPQPFSLQRAWNAAFSRGVGYEPQPPGSFFSETSVRGYFIDFRAKTTAPTAQAPRKLQPAALAQLALGWWERSLLGDREAPAAFQAIASALANEPEEHGWTLRWPYRVDVPKYRLSVPWYSAMAQGQIASVFVRAQTRHDDRDYGELACRAVEPLLRPGGSELAFVSSAGPILEEAPSDPPSHILNGWIFALWGLWDVHVGLTDAAAGAAFEDGVQCLRRLIDGYDVGWWTRYSLYPHPVVDLAKPFYHRLHVDQTAALYCLTGFSEFRQASERWRAYDTAPRRLRAIAQKGSLVIARRERS